LPTRASIALRCLSGSGRRSIPSAISKSKATRRANRSSAYQHRRSRTWLKRSRIPRTDWCAIATLFAEYAGAGRHFATQFPGLDRPRDFFPARCQEHSLAGVVVAALQPRSVRCDYRNMSRGNESRREDARRAGLQVRR
jgi:hypothetical protein